MLFLCFFVSRCKNEARFGCFFCVFLDGIACLAGCKHIRFAFFVEKMSFLSLFISKILCRGGMKKLWMCEAGAKKLFLPFVARFFSVFARGMK